MGLVEIRREICQCRDTASLLQLIAEAEKDDYADDALSEIYRVAVDAYKCLQPVTDERYAELSLKHMLLLSRLKPDDAREFHNRQRAFGLNQKDARMHVARAVLEEQQGDSSKASKMLREGLRLGAQPTELLRRCLADVEARAACADGPVTPEPYRRYEQRQSFALSSPDVDQENIKPTLNQIVERHQDEQSKKTLQSRSGLQPSINGQSALISTDSLGCLMTKLAATPSPLVAGKMVVPHSMQRLDRLQRPSETPAQSDLEPAENQLQNLKAVTLNRSPLACITAPEHFAGQVKASQPPDEQREEEPKPMAPSLHRELDRSHRALERLLTAASRQTLLAAVVSAWKTTLDWSAARRREALFDSLQNQIERAQRRTLAQDRFNDRIFTNQRDVRTAGLVFATLRSWHSWTQLSLRYRFRSTRPHAITASVDYLDEETF